MPEEPTLDNIDEWNANIIKEFRENDGKVGGPFEGAPMLLLHTVGAKSGKPRLNPLVYFPDGDRYLIVASKGGAPTNPAWYHNLLANPKAKIEVGTETVDVVATPIEGEERDRRYAEIAKIMPGFGEYQRKTTRVIPILALDPA